jgi:glycosyltransferase involved in cell wall biosynthesis
LADELGLGTRVEFEGFVSEERKLELLRRSWIHVLTSPKEGWGISILEAAACATPTIASDAPGLRDAVRDGETGVLVPHDEVDALADAVRQLVVDRPLRQRMGRAARRFAEGLSWDASARTLEAFLTERVAPGGARS